MQPNQHSLIQEDPISLPTIDEALEELGWERPANNKIPCPACGSEDTPACHLYEDHYYCFSCGKTGDGIGLLAAVTGANVRTLIRERSNGKRPLRVGPKPMAQGVNKAVKLQYRAVHDWWFSQLHEMYAGSQLWAFERALDLYSDMFDSLRAMIEGTDGWAEPLAPFKAEKEIGKLKQLLERSVPFEVKAAREARQR